MNSIEGLLALTAYLAFIGVLAQAAHLGVEQSTQAELRMACAILDYAATMDGVSLTLPENNFTASNKMLYLNGEGRACLNPVSFKTGLVVENG